MGWRTLVVIVGMSSLSWGHDGLEPVPLDLEEAASQLEDDGCGDCPQEDFLCNDLDRNMIPPFTPDCRERGNPWGIPADCFVLNDPLPPCTVNHLQPVANRCECRRVPVSLTGAPGECFCKGYLRDLWFFEEWFRTINEVY